MTKYTKAVAAASEGENVSKSLKTSINNHTNFGHIDDPSARMSIDPSKTEGYSFNVIVYAEQLKAQHEDPSSTQKITDEFYLRYAQTHMNMVFNAKFDPLSVGTDVAPDPRYAEYSYEEIIAMANNGANIPSEVIAWAKGQQEADIIDYVVVAENEEDNDSFNQEKSSDEGDTNRLRSEVREYAIQSKKAQEDITNKTDKAKDYANQVALIKEKQENISQENSLDQTEEMAKEYRQLSQNKKAKGKLENSEESRLKELSKKLAKNSELIRDMEKDSQDLDSFLESIDNLNSETRNGNQIAKKASQAASNLSNTEEPVCSLLKQHAYKVASGSSSVIGSELVGVDDVQLAYITELISQDLQNETKHTSEEIHSPNIQEVVEFSDEYVSKSEHIQNLINVGDKNTTEESNDVESNDVSESDDIVENDEAAESNLTRGSRRAKSNNSPAEDNTSTDNTTNDSSTTDNNTNTKKANSKKTNNSGSTKSTKSTSSTKNTNSTSTTNTTSTKNNKNVEATQNAEDNGEDDDNPGLNLVAYGMNKMFEGAKNADSHNPFGFLLSFMSNPATALLATSATIFSTELTLAETAVLGSLRVALGKSIEKSNDEDKHLESVTKSTMKQYSENNESMDKRANRILALSQKDNPDPNDGNEIANLMDENNDDVNKNKQLQKNVQGPLNQSSKSLAKNKKSVTDVDEQSDLVNTDIKELKKLSANTLETGLKNGVAGVLNTTIASSQLSVAPDALLAGAEDTAGAMASKVGYNVANGLAKGTNAIIKTSQQLINETSKAMGILKIPDIVNGSSEEQNNANQNTNSNGAASGSEQNSAASSNTNARRASRAIQNTNNAEDSLITNEETETETENETQTTEESATETTAPRRNATRAPKNTNVSEEEPSETNSANNPKKDDAPSATTTNNNAIMNAPSKKSADNSTGKNEKVSSAKKEKAVKNSSKDNSKGVKGSKNTKENDATSNAQTRRAPKNEQKPSKESNSLKPNSEKAELNLIAKENEVKNNPEENLIETNDNKNVPKNNEKEIETNDIEKENPEVQVIAKKQEAPEIDKNEQNPEESATDTTAPRRSATRAAENTNNPEEEIINVENQPKLDTNIKNEVKKEVQTDKSAQIKEPSKVITEEKAGNPEEKVDDMLVAESRQINMILEKNIAQSKSYTNKYQTLNDSSIYNEEETYKSQIKQIEAGAKTKQEIKKIEDTNMPEKSATRSQISALLPNSQKLAETIPLPEFSGDNNGLHQIKDNLNTLDDYDRSFQRAKQNKPGAPTNNKTPENNPSEETVISKQIQNSYKEVKENNNNDLSISYSRKDADTISGFDRSSLNAELDINNPNEVKMADEYAIAYTKHVNEADERSRIASISTNINASAKADTTDKADVKLARFNKDGAISSKRKIKKVNEISAAHNGRSKK